MHRTQIRMGAFAVGVLGLLGVASALTMDLPVTPEYVKANPKQFTVEAEKRADGLIHITITLHVARPSYLVANTELRDGGKVVFANAASAYVREDSATYYVTVSPERVGEAKFELFEGSFGESGGRPVPVVGGTNYKVDLGAFAKGAVETK